MPAPLYEEKCQGRGEGVIKVETENWEVRFRNCEFAYYLKEAEIKITMFAHLKEYQGNHEKF